MRVSIFAALGAYFCLTALAAESPKKPTGAEAQAAAARWIDGLDEKGLVLNQKVKVGGFVVTHTPSALGRVTKFSFQQAGCWVSFVFHGELSADTPLATLQDRFWFVTLDRLPVDPRRANPRVPLLPTDPASVEG